MKDYTVSNPEFRETIQIPETTDTNHADNINAAPKKNFENTVYLKNTVDELHGNQYTGRDLTVVFADEIKDYSDEWAWIKARIKSNDFSGLRNEDYIPLTVNGENHEMQLNIDPYYKTTDNQLGHHIDFISRHCYGGSTVQWNTENNNNGNANDSHPYMVSNLKSFLDNTLYPLLPDSVKNVISTKRMLIESRYSASGTLTDSTGWDWCDLGYLWVPTEYEVFGSVVWGTPGWSAGQAMQYPIFANSYKNREKNAGPTGGRCAWWLLCVRSGTSTSACLVSTSGRADGNSASGECRVPFCFRITDN